MVNSLLQRIFNQFSTMGSDVKNLFSTVGSLADLSTNDKTSFVRALNEVNTKPVSSSIELKGEIGAGIDLSTLSTGVYLQTMGNRALIELNYPVDTPGRLLVHDASDFIMQEYWTVDNKTYRRTKYGGTWKNWKELV